IPKFANGELDVTRRLHQDRKVMVEGRASAARRITDNTDSERIQKGFACAIAQRADDASVSVEFRRALDTHGLQSNDRFGRLMPGRGTRTVGAPHVVLFKSQPACLFWRELKDEQLAAKTINQK